MIMQSQARPTTKMQVRQLTVNEQGAHSVIAARAGCLSFWKLSDYDGRADGAPSYSGIDEGPSARSWNSTSGVSFHADGPGGSVPGSAAFGTTSHLSASHVNLFTGTRTATLFVKLNAKTTGRLLNLGTSFILSYNAAVDRFRLVVNGNTTGISIDADALGSPTVDKWYWIQVAYNAQSQEAGLRVVAASSLQLRQNLGSSLSERMTWLAVPGGVFLPGSNFSLNGYTATGCVCRMAGVGYWSRLLNEYEAAFLAAGIDWPFYWPTVTARLSPALSGWAGGTRPDPVYLLWSDTDATPVSYQLRQFEIDGAENIVNTSAFVSGSSLGALADYLDRNNDSNQAYLMVRGLNASGYPVTPWSNVVPGREYPAATAQSATAPGLRRPLATPAAPSGIGRAGTGPVTVSFTPAAGYRHEVWANYVSGAGYDLITTLAADMASYEDSSGTLATSYRVRAVGGGEPSDWIESLPPPPDAPSINDLENRSIDVVRVNFDHAAQSGGAWVTSYVLEYSLNGTDWATAVTETDPLVYFIEFATGQATGTDVWFRIKAVNGSGQSSWAYNGSNDPITLD